MGVGQESMLDLDLLGDGQGAAHGSRVDQDPIVDEERRRALPLAFASKRPEDLDLH
jgi:hypothetical protein